MLSVLHILWLFVCVGLSGSPDQQFWVDGTTLKFSRLKNNMVSDNHSLNASSYSCVLAEDPKIWTKKDCTTTAEHKFICSADAEVNKLRDN